MGPLSCDATIARRMLKQGIVYLVGAGPGDPQLITVRGRECLRQADVVLYDYLVNPILASWVRPSATTICLGQHGRSRIWTQDEIHQALRDHALQGKRVVRLKGGDPAIFARGAEEAEFLQQQGIPYEVVPGITAALASGSCAGIPLTHRDDASAVALVTGHEDAQRSESHIDYAALAHFPGTLVIYMGVTTAKRWVHELILNGMAPSTPTALIRRCSFPDQQVIHCSLEEVPARLTPRQKFPPPVIAIIGATVSRAIVPLASARGPLAGKTVLVTRARDQAPSIARRLRTYGARVLLQPLIAIRPPHDRGPLDAALSRLAEFDWLIFTSVNGVTQFFQRLWQQGRDARTLADRRIAAIGPATTAALKTFGLQADLQPTTFRAEVLADALTTVAPQGTFLLLRASHGRDTLATMLRNMGGHVTEVVAYETVNVTEVDPAITSALKNGLIDWIMVSSSSIARALHHCFDGTELATTRLVTISPLTSGVVQELGHRVTAEARSYTIDGMIDAMIQSEMIPSELNTHASTHPVI